jgi:SAM-dependent methyltransferase
VTTILQQDTATILRRYFSLYWLRPETALWRTMDWLAIRDVAWSGKTLSLCCGDGLNDYILMGGDPPIEMDDCMSVVEVSPKEFFDQGVDIYDASLSGDLPIVDPPPRRFDIGLDWKASLIDKAKLVGAHDDLIVHDVNSRLPIRTETIDTIFSNSLYWISKVEEALLEVRRILRPEGKFIVILNQPNLDNYAIYNLYREYGYEWARVLDRGRHRHIKQKRTIDEWVTLFGSSGFSVIDIKPFLSRRLVEISEIGLRPLFPVLAKMANCLDQNTRNQIKREWIDYLMYVGLPLVQSRFLNDPLDDQTYVCITVEKTYG